MFAGDLAAEDTSAVSRSIESRRLRVPCMGVQIRGEKRCGRNDHGDRNRRSNKRRAPFPALRRRNDRTRRSVQASTTLSPRPGREGWQNVWTGQRVERETGIELATSSLGTPGQQKSTKRGRASPGLFRNPNAFLPMARRRSDRRAFTDAGTWPNSRGPTPDRALASPRARSSAYPAASPRERKPTVESNDLRSRTAATHQSEVDRRLFPFTRELRERPAGPPAARGASRTTSAGRPCGTWSAPAFLSSWRCR